MSKRASSSHGPNEPAPEFTRQVPKFLRGLVDSRKPPASAGESDAFESAVLLDEHGREVSVSAFQQDSPAPAASSSVSAAPVRAAASTEAPSDWTTSTDAATKRVYYSHAKTATSTYMKPACLQSEAERALPQCRYVEYVKNLESYWFDQSTGDSTWEEPAEFVQFRTKLQRLIDSPASCDESVRQAARTCLALSTVDVDGSLARLGKLPAAQPEQFEQTSARKASHVPALVTKPSGKPVAPRNKTLLSFGEEDE
jgi:hypothetical protein